MGETDCLSGVCNAFICEANDNIPPLPPVITNIQELSQPLNGGAIRVRGYGEANTRVIIIIDGEELTESGVNSSGIFDVTFNSTITQDGVHLLQAYVRDTQNNKSDKSDVIAINIDRKKPEMTFSNIPDFTSFENILISGNTEKGSTIIAYRNNEEISRTGADANGNFDLILTLKDDENRFTIVAVDTIGNEATKDLTIRFDANSSNTLELLSSTNNKLTFSVPAEIVEIEILRNDKLVDSVKVDKSEFVYDLSPLIQGISTEFKFVGLDQTGNKTKATIYKHLNSTASILLFMVFILGVGVVGIFVYLVKIGKIQIPFLKNFNFSQTQMNLDIKEGDYLAPKKLRKEY